MSEYLSASLEHCGLEATKAESMDVLWPAIPLLHVSPRETCHNVHQKTRTRVFMPALTPLTVKSWELSKPEVLGSITSPKSKQNKTNLKTTQTSINGMSEQYRSSTPHVAAF